MNDTLLVMLGVIGLILFIFLIVKINKAVKHSHSVCSKCKKEYTYPESFDIDIGELKWEKKTYDEQKGDFTYEIEYKQYYRLIRIYLKCISCGYETSIVKRVDIYRSDSKYSYSEKLDIERIKSCVRKQFDKSMFAGKEIDICL